MWTKEQIWDFLMLIGSLTFLAVTIALTFYFGLTILFINAPVAFVGLFVHAMFRKMLAASKAQAEQAQRHVAELSSSIAEQERVSKELEKSEEKFRNAFDHAAVGMALVAAKGQLLKVNRSFCDVLGYTEDELLKMDFQSLLCKDDLYAFNVSLAKLFDGNTQKARVEERVKHKQGHTIWLLRDTSLVKDDADESSHFIFQLQNITDRKRAEERLAHDSLHDALTGLPNRDLFMDRLRVAFKSAHRHSNNQFAVLFVDFNKFKRVNDTFGHHVGDELLIATARRLETALPTNDTVARFGGNEFVMMIGDITNSQQAVKIAENLQKALAQPFNINGQEILMTFSIGIAMWTRDYESPEFLLRDADTALYQAKRLGRGRIEAFNPATHEREQHFLQLETDLHNALERNEFRLHYQPIVKLETGELIGVEALIRWQHPTRGLVSPNDFIPLAEETGLIAPIGLWVLREATTQLRTWQKRSATKLKIWVSVNVSGKQFMQEDLVRQVAAILQDTELPSHYLKLEITESAMMENIELAVDLMKRLKRLGAKLSIDDFGKGYSSLSHLLRLPLDSLKIDPAFVKDMHTSDESREIVKTVITLAQSLNLEVIAEGIENRSQIARLQELSCQYGQGFYFAKPHEPAAIEQLLAKQQNLHPVKTNVIPIPPRLQDNALQNPQRQFSAQKLAK